MGNKLVTQEKAIKTLADLSYKELVLTQPKKQFLASGGTEEDFAREAGFALQMIESSDSLKNCDRKSIVNAIVNVALTKLSLNPELKLGYLIPYKGKCFFRSSYMGKREIILRTGNVKDFYVRLVYKNDKFEILTGTENKIVHVPDSFGDRGELIGGYWVAKMVNDEIMFDTMLKKQIEKIRDVYSESHKYAAKKGTKDVWDDEFDEMAKKTICNAGFKNLPKTGITKDVINALNAEGKFENAEFQDYLKESRGKDGSKFEDEDEYTEAQIINEDNTESVTEKHTSSNKEPELPIEND